jgi:hypothetical protein
MKKSLTDCCALAQLSGLNNNTTIQELKEQLRKQFDEIKNKYIPGDSSGKGQRALFVITTPTEEVLEYTLKHCGFKEIHQFPRRNGYPEGMLKMFIKTL